MDALAVQYARELTLCGIETSIVLRAAFTSGTNHFAHAGTPADTDRAAEYETGPYEGYGKRIQEAFAAIVPPNADAGAVAEAIVKLVDTCAAQIIWYIDYIRSGLVHVKNKVPTRVPKGPELSAGWQRVASVQCEPIVSFEIHPKCFDRGSRSNECPVVHEVLTKLNYTV